MGSKEIKCFLHQILKKGYYSDKFIVILLHVYIPYYIHHEFIVASRGN